MTHTIRHGELADLAGDLGDTIDVFICSASFEDRCLSVAKSLRRECIDRVVIVKDRTVQRGRRGEFSTVA